MQAAKTFVGGAPAHPAEFEKVAETLDETTRSSFAKSASKQPLETGQVPGGEPGLTPLAEPRFGAPGRVFLKGHYHDLRIGRIGNRWSFLLCGGGCGPIIEKARAMLARIPKSHPAYGELRELINKAKNADTWVNDVLEVVKDVGPNEAQAEIKRLETALNDIEARHPGAFDPEVVPNPARQLPRRPRHRPKPRGPRQQYCPPRGVPTRSLRVGRETLSLRGLDADLPLRGQLVEGEMAALKRSPNLVGVGAEDLPYLSPRDLADGGGGSDHPNYL